MHVDVYVCVCVSANGPLASFGFDSGLELQRC
jgi:hypothetical protein